MSPRPREYTFTAYQWAHMSAICTLPTLPLLIAVPVTATLYAYALYRDLSRTRRYEKRTAAAYYANPDLFHRYRPEYRPPCTAAPPRRPDPDRHK